MEVEWLLDYNPVLLAPGATIFTWFITALGSSMVFFLKKQTKRF
jgi:ZIP family zinc transporter